MWVVKLMRGLFLFTAETRVHSLILIPVFGLERGILKDFKIDEIWIG